MYVFQSKINWGKQYNTTQHKRICPKSETMADDKSLDESTKPVPTKPLKWAGTQKHPVKQIKTKVRRGYGRTNHRKNEKGNQLFQFSIIGTNSAGLNSKKDFFYKIINKFRPSVITIQESKLSRPGLIKTQDIKFLID